jgi:hypothetical protein
MVSVLISGRAAADYGDHGLRLSVDWGKLDEVIRDGANSLERPLRSPVSSTETRLFGVSPHVSLIARDWGGAQLLLGHLSLTDQVRLSRSSRMFITRLRLTEGRIAPFVQAGLGQWRIDTDLMPVLPRDVEFAGQTGGGFDAAVASMTSVSIEADYTILYREAHEPQMVTQPHLWGTFLIARTRF